LRSSNEQIQCLAGRLISAQEVERARIARELHDDVSQQLAGFSIAISGLKRRPEARDNAELLDVLSSLQSRTIGLTEDIRVLSHELHPAVLHHAGLTDALRAHCSEFAKQHAIAVVVEAQPELGPIDSAKALCLYRITQEALRNVAKHADARQVHVNLSRRDDQIHLSIADDGKGFDLAQVSQNGNGLGLRSIDERVRLARGQLSIDAAPGQGTTLSVRLDVEVLSADLAGV
jgi:signal transduction histidine kinase